VTAPRPLPRVRPDRSYNVSYALEDTSRNKHAPLDHSLPRHSIFYRLPYSGTLILKACTVRVTPDHTALQ
jgi:hypothetical protein